MATVAKCMLMNIFSFPVNIEDTAPILKKEVLPKPEPLRVGDVERLQTPLEPGTKGKTNNKASDDVIFEKFKKQMRRF